ncbi:MAG TPA: response regulator [Methylomirabilota bacterium]|nr:response regulator [Methylomirabilota bacterium]
MVSACRPLTVVLVDDDGAWRTVLGGWLEGEGMRVIRLARGEWITSAVETHRADVVLLDVHLPGLDGLDVLEALHRRWPALPIIVMTAFGGPDTADLAHRCGATAYLDKPFRMTELMDHMERIAERGESH